MSRYCIDCGEVISEGNEHWYNDESYCENCFYEYHTYCQRCDEAISRDNCRYDDNDDAICDRCWEEEIDDNAPDNPNVNDSERKQIINLSKCWLRGEKPKTLIRINRNDHHLSEIQSGVGFVDHALYVYGLQDRDEYQIKASADILESVRNQISELNLTATVYEDIGNRRLGLSRTLREENRNEIIELIKNIHNSPQGVSQTTFIIHNL